MSRESLISQLNPEPTALLLLPPAEPFLQCNGAYLVHFLLHGCTKVQTSILRNNLLSDSARDMSQGMCFPNNSHDAVWAAAGREQLFHELHTIKTVTFIVLYYFETVFESQKAQVGFSHSEILWSPVCVSGPSKSKLGRQPYHEVNNGTLSILFHIISESMQYSHLRAGRSATLFRYTITLNTEETAQFSVLELSELPGSCKCSFLLYQQTELSNSVCQSEVEICSLSLFCFGCKNNTILFTKICE